MTLLESPYYNRGGAALDADNVPLGGLPIVLLYENSIDIKISRFLIHYMILLVGRLSTPTVCNFCLPIVCLIEK